MAPKTAKRKTTSSKPEVVQLSADVEQYAIDVPTPTSAGKRKSAQVDDDSSPKRQKLPVRVKSSGAGRHRSLSVEMPFPQSSQRERSDEVRDSQDEESEAEVFKTPMTRKHVKFDSDDYDEFMTPLERPAAKAGSLVKKLDDVVEDSEEDSEEEDSDDEAPEAVSTHQAAEQSAKAAQAAAKAAEQQASEKKRKRRERDSQLKQQAKSRKSALGKTKGPERASEEPESEGEAAAQPQLVSHRKKKLEVPDVLPPEFLESDDEEDEDDVQDVSLAIESRRIKFDEVEKRLGLEDRAPRDEQVGGTLYRVVKNKADKKLAPKMRKETRNLKAQFLSRNRAPQKRRGFLVRA